MFQTEFVEKIKNIFYVQNIFVVENRAFYEIMCKNIVKMDGPQMVRVHISDWIPKATDKHSEYVILIGFPLQQLLQARVSVYLSQSKMQW
jgi:hypothetical protein